MVDVATAGGDTPASATPDTMPVFVIKAKDALAPEAVTAYRDLCTKYQLHQQAEQVQLALDEIVAWQKSNEDELGLPDHLHVPAWEATE